MKTLSQLLSETSDGFISMIEQTSQEELCQEIAYSQLVPGTADGFLDPYDSPQWLDSS